MAVQRTVIPAGGTVSESIVMPRGSVRMTVYWPDGWTGATRCDVQASWDRGASYHKLHRQNGFDLDIRVKEGAATTCDEEPPHCQYLRLVARREQDAEREIVVEFW